MSADTVLENSVSMMLISFMFPFGPCSGVEESCVPAVPNLFGFVEDSFPTDGGWGMLQVVIQVMGSDR